MKYKFKINLPFLFLFMFILLSCANPTAQDTKLEALAKRFTSLYPNGYKLKSGWYEIVSTYSYGHSSEDEYEGIVTNNATIYLDYDNYGEGAKGHLLIKDGIYTQKIIGEYETAIISLWLKSGDAVIKEKRNYLVNGVMLPVEKNYTTKFSYFGYWFGDKYNSLNSILDWNGDGTKNVNASFQLDDSYLKYSSTEFIFFEETGYMGSNQSTEYYFFDSDLNITRKERHTSSVNHLNPLINSTDTTFKSTAPITVDLPVISGSSHPIDAYVINLETLKYPGSYLGG